MARPIIHKKENGIVFFSLSNKSNLVCKIDDNDFYILESCSWFIHKSTKNGLQRWYIRKTENGGKKAKTIHLHRYILGLKDFSKDSIVDHIDLDGLNNCRKNLRIVDMRISNRNKSNSSKFSIGETTISFIKKRGIYQAYNNSNYVGSSKSLEKINEIVVAYNKSKEEN